MLKIRLSAVSIALLLVIPGAQAQDPAGRVLWLHGQVERIGADGVAKPLSNGGIVLQGDTIRTSAGSHAQLIMSDDALVAVRPASSVRLTTYNYQGTEDGSERALIDLIKGGLRSVTGAIGRSNKENYLIRNGSHLVGIRGTDHETFTTETGTYNRVTLGATYLQSPQGRVDLAPGEIGFVGLTPNAVPSRLDRTPEFMHVAALKSGSTGPGLRANDHVNPAGQIAAPGLSAQPLNENGHHGGLGNGGRCGGPCVDPLQHGSGKGGASKRSH
jgi:hypothetical protein